MGFDVHAFAGEGPIMMGGVAIPHERGLPGTATPTSCSTRSPTPCSARPALGDIGQHFPPCDPQWKGAASDQFPGSCRSSWSRQRGGIIDHVDCTVICEAPQDRPVP